MATSTPDSTATITRNNIGPLTTVFTPPAQCDVCTYIGTYFAANGQSYADVCGVWWSTCSASPLACLPSSSVSWDTANTNYFYSPGLSCPYAWTTVTAVTSGQGTETSQNVPTDTLLPGETAAICCPSGYDYAPPDLDFNFGRCSSQTTTGTYSYLHCWDQSTFTLSRMGTEITVPDMSSSVFYQGVRIVAPLVQINWRSQDREAVSASQSPVAVTSSAFATQSTSPLSGGSSSVSAGVEAGIAIGALLAGVLIGVGLFLAYRRWQSKSATRPFGSGMPELEGGLKPGGTSSGSEQNELSSTPAYGGVWSERHELDAVGR